jgi:hypothetical protein
MISTTRSRVSFFMNRFRKLGFIEYNGEIRVHNSQPPSVRMARRTTFNLSKPIQMKRGAG